jgi:hypothetical protein
MMPVADSPPRAPSASPAPRSSPRPGITRDDIDRPVIYDAFPNLPIYGLEDLGLCATRQGRSLHRHAQCRPRRRPAAQHRWRRASAKCIPALAACTPCERARARCAAPPGSGRVMMRVDADDISGAARRSDPPLTKLPGSRRQAGVRMTRTPASKRGVACEFPQWVATCPWHPGFPASAIRSVNGPSSTLPRFRA